MSDLFDDSDLLSDDYKKYQKEDDLDLDDDLDDGLLYSSDEEPVPAPQQDTTSFPMVTIKPAAVQVAPAQPSSVLENSDSEGTDTRDETDDLPLIGDNAARNKIKIYRTISNTGNDKAVETVSVQKNNQVTLKTMPVSTEEVDDTSVVEEDEESEDDEKSERGRFRSERDGKTLPISSRRRTSDKREIPDTLEISKEEQEKIEEFDQQQKLKRNRRNRGIGNRRGFPSQGRHAYGQGRGNRFPHSHRPRYQQPGIVRAPAPRPGGNPPQRPSLLGNPPAMLQPFPQQPPRFPMHVPPPNWVDIRSVPPPILPGQPLPPMPQLLTGPTLQPPSIPITVAPSSEPQSSIPVVSGRTLGSELQTSKEVNQGNPIPTLVNQGNRADIEASTRPEAKSRRETIYDDKDRNSPRLSVRFNRSRSSSRSPSPVPRNSKRLVLKPRRSRSPKSRSRRRAKSPKKKSRRRSRSRSRSYSPRRRSRSRSYSPKRRSPSPRRKTASQSTAPKPGKILINPHFKGARSLPTPITVQPAIVATTVASTSTAPRAAINPLLFSIPPPPLPTKVNPLVRAPPININVPPPQLPTSASGALSTAPPKINPPINLPLPTLPPPIAIPPPGTVTPGQPPPIGVSKPSQQPLPPNPIVQTPNNPAAPPPFRLNAPPPGIPPNQPLPGVPRNQPPPAILPNQPPPVINRPPGIDVTRPPPAIPQQNVGSPPARFPVSDMPRRPQFVEGPRLNVRPPRLEPTVHIRPERNVRPQGGFRPQRGPAPRLQQHRGPRNQLNQHASRPVARGKSNAIVESSIRSRLKPPPGTTNKPNRMLEPKMWQKDIGSTPDYQERMKQQAERRKEILAMKAKRRGKGTDPQGAIVATIRSTVPPPTIKAIKITNLASATKLQTIEKLMKAIGPVHHVEFNEKERCVLGSFKSAVHAQQFVERYNRL